ncbi:hypothetical protein [Scatolibacter rhodanostii]|uniref:hypothetical protein n=1 Tax=Scatolibacter rhodanostii TaxID=2014781 RepID=UPI000C06A74E|nr:hypothetical protein [Scatolibacter rhodanostii]
MKIRNVKICLSEDIDSPIKATADIYIKDGFRVRNMRIIENLDHTLGLEFESPIIKHTTFEPWTPEAKRMIERIVIGAYWKKVHTPHNAIESDHEACYNTDTE